MSIGIYSIISRAMAAEISLYKKYSEGVCQILFHRNIGSIKKTSHKASIGLFVHTVTC